MISNRHNTYQYDKYCGDWKYTYIRKVYVIIIVYNSNLKCFCYILTLLNCRKSILKFALFFI